MVESKKNLGRNVTNVNSNERVFSYKMMKKFHIETNLAFNRSNDE